jgi:hypothetical protein
MTTTQPTKATARQAWATVYTTLLAADIVPLSVSLHPSDIGVTVRLRDDRPSEVDRALSLLSMPEGGIYCSSGTSAFRWNEGTEGEFVVYGLYAAWEESPAVAGWVVNLHCHIHANQAAVRS